MRIVMIAFTNIEYTIELTEALSSLEDVMLMIPDKQAERFESVIDPKLKVCPFFYPRLRQLSNLKMVYSIFSKIRSFKPDIIHVQKGHPWFNFILPFLKRYCLVTTIHDPVLLDWPSQRIPAFTYLPPIKYAKQLIVHGEKLKESMLKEYKCSPEDVHVLKRGVNSIYTRYIQEPLADDGCTVMYFGRIWEYKGVRYLIEAEPLISKECPDLRIVIAGKGEDLSKYRKMMVNKDKFIIHDEHIPDRKVAQLFQEASIIVLPYTDGSQSGVIPQAYAFKKPVVVTDVGSLPEAVDNGVTGYVIPSRDSKKLAEVIIDLLKDKEKRIKMSENAYKKTQEDLCWKKIAADNIEVYKRALSIK